MGTWESGMLEVGTRCFDLLCTGKCNLAETNLKLNIESVDKIPNFFTKNSEGKIIFSNPLPMSVITTPKGHGTWIRIELKTINGMNVNSLSGIAKHMCLGIKKRSENNYFDVIHAEKLTSEHIDLFDTDAVELVPLLSKTEITSDGYELVKTGDEVTPSDFGVTETSFDFGSVYRINIKDEGAWITRKCNLKALNPESDSWWRNPGVGLLAGQKEEQLLCIRTNGELVYSIDGMSWTEAGNLGNIGVWMTSPKYGNGVWCITNRRATPGITSSFDGGKSWEAVQKIGSLVLEFNGSVFMILEHISGEFYSKVYTSPDARTWTEIGIAPSDINSWEHTILIYGNNKWICGSYSGVIYQSKDGKEWEQIGEISTTQRNHWFNGCYANGYFYVTNEIEHTVMRSATGEKWEEVITLPGRSYAMTYYKNKLYAVDYLSRGCYIGIPNP